jgi:hypothetical protein
VFPFCILLVHFVSFLFMGCRAFLRAVPVQAAHHWALSGDQAG